jgi:Mg2+ and Co2+ transporter CorA
MGGESFGGNVEKVQEPPGYSFIWFFAILAVILFPVFFWWIRRQNRS